MWVDGTEDSRQRKIQVQRPEAGVSGTFRDEQESWGWSRGKSREL